MKPKYSKQLSSGSVCHTQVFVGFSSHGNLIYNNFYEHNSSNRNGEHQANISVENIPKHWILKKSVGEDFKRSKITLT